VRHASRHNTAKYSALVRHEFCWAVESITCMSPHALPCAADAVVVYETLPLEDEQVSRIGMSRPHPSLEKLEMTYQTKLDLIQVLRDLKMTYQTKSDLIQVSRDSKMTHPSLERLENDL
jgi:DNA-directed RNA polymerase subunit L